MSTYIRQPGDLAIQIYVPAEVGFEIGKLRLTSRKSNNVILNELLAEALVARGLLVASEAPTPQTKPAQSGKPVGPKKSKKPGAPVEWTNPVTSLAQLPKPKSYAQQQAEAQLSLPAVATTANPDVTVSDAVTVRDTTDVTDPAPVTLEAFFGLGEPPAASPPVTRAKTDAEKGFVFLDPDAPLDLSILSRVDEEESKDPFEGLDLSY